MKEEDTRRLHGYLAYVFSEEHINGKFKEEKKANPNIDEKAFRKEYPLKILDELVAQGWNRDLVKSFMKEFPKKQEEAIKKDKFISTTAFWLSIAITFVLTLLGSCVLFYLVLK